MKVHIFYFCHQKNGGDSAEMGRFIVALSEKDNTEQHSLRHALNK